MKSIEVGGHVEAGRSRLEEAFTNPKFDGLIGELDTLLLEMEDGVTDAEMVEFTKIINKLCKKNYTTEQVNETFEPEPE